MHQDERGHNLTTSSTEAANELDLAIHNFLHWKADVVPHVGASLKADPEFAFAHVVGGLIMHGARNVHFRGRIDGALAEAQKFSGGGHRTAAGFKCRDSRETTKAKVLDMLAVYFT